MMLLKTLFAGVISFLTTFYLIPVLYNIALSLRVVDVPDGKIKCHARTTPYLGGIAMYAGFITALALIFPFDNQYTLFLIGLTLLVLVGLIDDLVVLSPLHKFFGQCIAALCFLKAGLYIKERFFYQVWIAIPLSFIWIISIINAFNLVDVMDGLATTIAATATFTFLGIAYLYQQPALMILLGSFLGPLGAFFWYNKPEAKIYMGDAGALFLGGFLSVVPFLFNWGKHNQYGYLISLIVLAIPLLELIGLIIIRSYKRIPFYKGSPDHFSIYLKNRGWKIWQILGFVFGLSLILMVYAILFACNSVSLGHLMIASLLFVIFWIATVFVKKCVLQVYRNR